MALWELHDVLLVEPILFQISTHKVLDGNCLWYLGIYDKSRGTDISPNGLGNHVCTWQRFSKGTTHVWRIEDLISKSKDYDRKLILKLEYQRTTI